MRFVAILVLVSCVSGVEMRPYTATSQRAQPELYSRSVRVFADRGLTAETNDVNAGVVISSWETEEILGTKRRMRWRVTVDDKRISVMSDCQTHYNGEWHTCDSQPEERARLAVQIATEIAK